MSCEQVLCKECKHWDPNAKEVETFLSYSLRRERHTAGVGLCGHIYSILQSPAPADERFGWCIERDRPADIFTGPEFGCVRGER